MIPENYKRLLVIDDDSCIRAILNTIFKKKYNVHKSSSADEAISYLKENSADLIIIDFMMPNKNGLEATIEIKELKRDQDIIVLSGYIDDETKTKFKKAGVLDVLKKPFDTKELSGKVNEVLSI